MRTRGRGAREWPLRWPSERSGREWTAVVGCATVTVIAAVLFVVVVVAVGSEAQPRNLKQIK